jgi:hypothetical protein
VRLMQHFLSVPTDHNDEHPLNQVCVRALDAASMATPTEMPWRKLILSGDDLANDTIVGSRQEEARFLVRETARSRTHQRQDLFSSDARSRSKMQGRKGDYGRTGEDGIVLPR